MSQTNQINATEYKAIDNGQINVDEAEGVVECFVAGIGNKDGVGDICAPGCFTESLKRRKPRVVWGHNWNEPIGKVLEIYEVTPNDPRLPMKMKRAGIGGLYARVQFNMKSERGKQAFLDISFFGNEQEWSIGYKTLDAEYDSNRQANVLKEVELYEVSPVLHGANQLTGTISIKSEEKANEPIRDPDGGLTAAGRRHFNETEGSNLKPGVDGPADTPDKMRRKGSFLTRFFTNPSGPMKDEKGEPTRLALSASAWGEAVPQNMEDAEKLAEKGRNLLERYKGQKEKNHATPPAQIYNAENDDDDYSGPRGEDGGVPAVNPAMGRVANLARALAMRFGGAVRMRSADKNMVIFDHRKQGEEDMTMRVTYHFDGDEFMFGEPVKVRAETVYLPADNSPIGKPQDSPQEVFENRYQMGENPMVPEGVKPKMNACKCGCMAGKENEEITDIKAPLSPDAIPQENVTGDVLRGYGPRRGNLEALLRYWRPIMKNAGGFRRCKVILADHPELYPLNNICAWLHHETTGLWPNEGCHHPGMQNCRKKIRGVTNGSIWNESEWANRLDKIPDGKAMHEESEEDDLNLMSAYEIEEKAASSLKEFLAAQPEFVKYIEDDSKWEHVGESEEEKGALMIHASGDTDGHKDCGCGGACSSSPEAPKPILGVIQAIASLEKSLDGEMFTKAGRVLNNRNLKKLKDILGMLQEVISSAGSAEVEVKDDSAIITAAIDDLFEVKSLIDPVLDYHQIESYVTEDGIHLSGLTTMATEAINAAVNVYKSTNR